MATVYLAEDLRHVRRVAIKVLRPDLAAVIGAERFVREIRTIAALQHPHILGLIDSGELDRTAYYVMPFVEGESLRDRLTREKQLPVDEAVRLAREVAGALDYAHRHGVIHRDIKPENILLHDGQALVADFGIALAVSSASSTRMTETGMSLGTPHYMSPEQAMGERDITPCADVYALGCVLYEMLTGEPPFTGATAQAIVARVLTEPPRSITAARHTVPVAIEAATFRALEKLPADRFGSAAEFANALANPDFTAGAPRIAPGGAAAPLTRRSSAGAAALAAAALLFAALAAWGWLRPAPRQAVRRYAMGFEPGQELRRGTAGIDLALSPDGFKLVYLGPGDDGGQLWLRDRDRLEAAPIPGTAGAMNPVFSPDGKQIAFSAGRDFALKVVSITGGPPTTLAAMGGTSVGGSSWGPGGWIYVDSPGGLSRVPATGGRPEMLIRADSAGHEVGLAWPDALPNGRGVLYRSRHATDPSDYDLVAFDLRTHSRRVLAKGVLARYIAGYLVYVRADGAVLAAPFDQDELRITGPAVTLFDGVAVKAFGAADFAISRSGTLAYVRGAGAGGEGPLELITVTRAGVVAPLVPRTRFTPGEHRLLSLSPDGRAVALEVGLGGSTDIWVKQLPSGVLTRLTFDSGGSGESSWTPDGRSLVYVAFRDSGTFAVWRRRADGSAPAGRLLRIAGVNIDEPSVSRDGEWLIYRSQGVGAAFPDIFARRLRGDTTPVPLVTGQFLKGSAALSPDGRWLAYTSGESGRFEIYVRPFPRAGDGRWQVSLAGGLMPHWAADGHELLFEDNTGIVMSARIRPGSTFAFDEPRAALPDSAARSLISGTRPFDVFPDGRLLASRLAEATNDPRGNALVMVDGWLEELRVTMTRK